MVKMKHIGFAGRSLFGNVPKDEGGVVAARLEADGCQASFVFFARVIGISCDGRLSWGVQRRAKEGLDGRSDPQVLFSTCICDLTRVSDVVKAAKWVGSCAKRACAIGQRVTWLSKAIHFFFGYDFPRADAMGIFLVEVTFENNLSFVCNALFR